MTNGQKALLALLILAGLLILASFLYSNGITVTYDSKFYLVAADLMSHQDGWLGKRVVYPHWQLLYPLCLAFCQCFVNERFLPHYVVVNKRAYFQQSILPLDRYVQINLQYAQGLNLICLGLLIYGMFLLGWKTANLLVGYFCAGLTAFSPIILSIYKHAWSEVVFLPILVFFLLALFSYEKERKFSTLVLSAILAGLAVLTRWAGFFCVATGAIIVFWIHRRGSPIRLFLWIGLACLPLFLGISTEFNRQTSSCAATGFVQMLEFVKVFWADVSAIGLLLILVGILSGIRLWPTAYVYCGIYAFLVFYYMSWHMWIYELDSTRLLQPLYPIVILFIASTLGALIEGNQNLAESKQRVLHLPGSLHG